MSRQFFADLGERTVATYVTAVITLWIGGWTGTWWALLWAALPAGLSVIKGGLAALVGDHNSAALLPQSPAPASAPSPSPPAAG